MTPAELRALLLECYRETLELAVRYQQHARRVGRYDDNNAYQQVLSRQETHLQWLADAITGVEGTVPGEAPAPPELEGDASALIRADVLAQRAFLERWAPRVSGMTNARHAKLLELLLGEMAEHLRVFEMAAEGRTDMLGRHPKGQETVGRVLAERPRG